jgi:thiamine biosynthesis lipoprotein
MKPGLYAHPAGGRLVPVLLVAMVAGAVAWVVLRPKEPQPASEGRLVAVGGNTMGGTWSVKLRKLPPTKTVEQLRTSCQSLLDRLEAAMSTYREDSEVSRFNRHEQTDWFPVSPDVAAIVTVAQQVSEQTGGAFDISVAPCVNLWGFGPKRSGLRAGKIPSDEEVERARSHVGYQHLYVRLAPPALRKDDADLAIDLSGIAKGYAANELSKMLDQLGAGDYLIAVGGELRAKGQSSPGIPWRVGIEVPTPDTRRILRQIELRDAGVSTSGDYRNFFDVGGRRFSHELDPRTGRPVEHPPASVSVVHADSAYADAMATALMVLGPAEGYDRARALHLAALFVTRGRGAFDVHATPEFEKLLAPAPASSSSVESAQ